MKNLIYFKSGALTLLTASIMLLALNSCAKKVSFSKSKVTPAADGYAKVKHNDNNYRIEVILKNLARAKDLSPSRNTYLVWADTNDGTKKLGQMNSSHAMLSKALKASLEATLPEKPTRIFITAEDDADTSYPSMETVLETGDF